MINTTRSKNRDWRIGSVVSIGFVKNLTVTKVEAIKDGLPDVYTLHHPSGKTYEFIPHNGLHRIQ